VRSPTVRCSPSGVVIDIGAPGLHGSTATAANDFFTTLNPTGTAAVAAYASLDDAHR
jgi:hypothetical protein